MLWLENKHIVIIGSYSFAWPVEACCGHFATIPKKNQLGVHQAFSFKFLL